MLLLVKVDNRLLLLIVAVLRQVRVKLHMLLILSKVLLSRSEEHSPHQLDLSQKLKQLDDVKLLDHFALSLLIQLYLASVAGATLIVRASNSLSEQHKTLSEEVFGSELEQLQIFNNIHKLLVS